jgi:CDGSH-type Zn-finger protein
MTDTRPIGSGAGLDAVAGAAASQRDAAEAVVAVYEDGPLILRGRFVITAQDGEPIAAGRRTVALCRCGRSAIKPFCDGSHARTGFRAPGRVEGMRAASENPADSAAQGPLSPA